MKSRVALRQAQGPEQSRETVFGLWIACSATLLTLATTSMAQSRPTNTQPIATTAPMSQPAFSLPITFARSGQQAEILLRPLPGGRKIEKAVVLFAFGRSWSDPTDVIQTSAITKTTITVPPVRVPTVFAVRDLKTKFTVGELVAYPDSDTEWHKKLTLYSCGTPAWFNQWATAIGLPVKQVARRELPSAKLAPDKEDGKSLLILGRATAAEEFSELWKQVKANPRPVLVLDAEWFGQSAGPVSVAPAQMLGVLAEMAKQQWAQSLKFNSHRRPWDGIANRWAWIVDESGLPLVEQIRGLGWREVCSYLSWPDVLGRSEQADELLLAILKEAASLEAISPRKIRPPQSALADAARFEPLEVNMLYPARKDVSPVDRPVLSSALPSVVFSVSEPSILFVLDLRGKVQLPADVLDRCRGMESRHNPNGERKLRIEATDPDPWRGLLILGDDKILDEWQWLKLDRAKKTINRPGVIWLSDDELPPSKDNQIRLMLKLTELDVPLAPPIKEEKKQ